MFGRQIRVTLVDAETGESISEMEQPAGDLPETFETYTTLRVGNATWEVMTAEPADRREYLKTGSLRLQIRRVEATSIPISELSYSLPTIDRRMPEIDEGISKFSKNILEIIEDDWRQIEFVSKNHLQAVQAELQRITRVIADSAGNATFRDLIVRETIQHPLGDVLLSTDELLAEMYECKPFEGLGFRNVQGVISDGFAIRTGEGLYLYGQSPARHMTVLGLLRARSAKAPADDASAIAELMRSKELVLVDWCKGIAVESEAASEYICSNIAFQVA